MATVSINGPNITISFTPQEMQTVGRILANNTKTFQDLVNQWLQANMTQYQQKDQSNINAILATATPQQITQVCQLLGIPQN